MKSATLALFALIACALSASPVMAQRPCSAEEHRHFDFWEGRWMVRASNGALAGHNTIERILGSCALREQLHDPVGLRR